MKGFRSEIIRRNKGQNNNLKKQDRYVLEELRIRLCNRNDRTEGSQDIRRQK